MNSDLDRRYRFISGQYITPGRVMITRQVSTCPMADGTDELIKRLDHERGALFSSSYDYPGRYTRWDIGFAGPCLELKSSGRAFTITLLKAKAGILLPLIFTALNRAGFIDALDLEDRKITGKVKAASGFFPEEQRSRQPTIFSVIRTIKDLLGSDEEHFLGFYGAFGYDLVFQFEDLTMKHERDEEQADLCLYLPDEILVIDHRMVQAFCLRYDFALLDIPTERIPEVKMDDLKVSPTTPPTAPFPLHQKGRYAGLVREAQDCFARGDLFEVVPSHTLYEPCPYPASHVFRRLQGINPSPYGFLINLGSEHLVGASPEMYVRVIRERVETCPISGTIARGKDALEDAEQIRALLNSGKDEAELTMCTDVDRNDKSRICRPGSVRVIGRRQIEMYSHLIHTVDHVEGRLEDGFDSLDAFLTHMWAVTVTGAPKKAAIQWIEDHEDSPRMWYGGAVGYLAFNGVLNTGLTLRTIRIRDGRAEIRVGATLLADSIPEEEEEETYLKAAAMKKAIHPQTSSAGGAGIREYAAGQGKDVILVDHEDSFVHTLAAYFRNTGARVSVLRAPLARKMLASGIPCDLLVLSPGPGRPRDFEMNKTIHVARSRELPIFGVCLGLQGLVEYYGGRLDQLPYPQHGKISRVIKENPSLIWEGLPSSLQVGRYHSLYARELPPCLTTIANSEDGIVMAVEHVNLPVFAVQFHPESIMTSQQDYGMIMINNVMHILIQAQTALGASGS
ncbi:MAG TPA: anthranilate synthase component I [Syntrophomonadaceae bacterium]|nr:anthranilate synthase component I [Syntrophomonadaceae bacterium]